MGYVMKLLVAFLTLAFAFEGYLMPNTAAPNPPEEGYLLVANKGTEAMGIIDPSAGRQIAEVAEGGTTGHEIAASPDGRTAYVPITAIPALENPAPTAETWLSSTSLRAKSLAMLISVRECGRTAPYSVQRTECCTSRLNWTKLLQ